MYKKISLIVMLTITSPLAAQEHTPIKVYALDCGNIEVSDFSVFSDTGEYDGKTANLADTCFLISHPKGYFLWDTGLPDSIIKNPETKNDIFHLTKKVSLPQQLKEIGLTTEDIKYVAISHSHFDHTGGLEHFPHSTWILNEKEIAHAEKDTDGGDFTQLTAWKTANKEIISSDFDVFKDGTVKILNTPGHTPGHQTLQVQLPKSGVVIITGDDFHQRTSFEPLIIPVFNTDRNETINSANRIKEILKNTDGRLIILHEKNDIDSLPKFPNYLE